MKCYIEGTSFRCPDGTFKRVEHIRQHEALVGQGGIIVEVAKMIRHEPEDRMLLGLLADDTTLIVTDDHRIVVPRGEQQQTIPAGHLRAGDVVLGADGGQKKLLDVSREMFHIEVYQLAFKPDVAMETFFTMDPAILTMGSKLKLVATRRGGMNRKPPMNIRDSSAADSSSTSGPPTTSGPPVTSSTALGQLTTSRLQTTSPTAK